MTWSLVASKNESLGSVGGTTSVINTVTADLIIVAISCWNSSPALSDSAGNTWTLAFQQTAPSESAQYLNVYFCFSPTTSASHTFTVGGGTETVAIDVEAWKGSAGSGSYDQKNEGGSSSSDTSNATGSITPTANGDLLFFAVATDGSATGMSPSIGTLDANISGVPFANQGLGTAYYVQPTAAAINPTWSWTGSANSATGIVSFKAGGFAVTANAVSFAEALKTNKMG